MSCFVIDIKKHRISVLVVTIPNDNTYQDGTFVVLFIFFFRPLQISFSFLYLVARFPVIVKNRLYKQLRGDFEIIYLEAQRLPDRRRPVSLDVFYNERMSVDVARGLVFDEIAVVQMQWHGHTVYSSKEE